MVVASRRAELRYSHLFMVTLLVFMLGCGSDSNGPPTGPSSTGRLLVNVSTMDGATGAIHITGPAGYSHTVTATTTLTDLPVGTYAVTADSAELPDSIVGSAVYTATVAGGAPSVAKNQTAQATVAYMLAHRRGALWISNVVPSLIENVAVDRLRASGTVLPSTEAFDLRSYGMTFDAAGNMWVGSDFDHAISMFTIAQRMRAGPTSPAVVLQSPSIIEARQIAFDRNGTLWVVDDVNGLLGFTAEQLTSGTSGLTPAYHVQDTLSINPIMISMAFDTAGNAWVGYDQVKQLVEFTPTQLTISGPQAPAKRLTPVSWGIPFAMTFDSHGNLWVADFLRFKVISFTPSQLTAEGSPTPNVKLDVEYPRGLAFDNSGSLWVSDEGAGVVYRFPPSQLAASGQPTAAVTISLNNGIMLSDFGAVAFDPWVVAPSGSVPAPPSDAAHTSRASRLPLSSSNR